VYEFRKLVGLSDTGVSLALEVAEVIVTTMSRNSKTVALLLSLTLGVLAGLNLSSPQVKQVLSTVASAVWGS
jgi:hypothetical protein